MVDKVLKVREQKLTRRMLRVGVRVSKERPHPANPNFVQRYWVIDNRTGFALQTYQQPVTMEQAEDWASELEKAATDT